PVTGPKTSGPCRADFLAVWRRSPWVDPGMRQLGRGAPLCPRCALKQRRLLLDARGVDVLRLSNLTLVTLASLKPFFCNGLKKALHFLDNIGASAPGIQ